MVDRYNGDLANNFGNLLSRVATVVGKKCDGVGPAPDPTARSPRWRRRLRGDARAWGESRRRRRSTPRGASSARPTPCSRTTSPGRLDPGPEVEAVLGDALEALRIVAVLASPALPTASAEAWRRIGLDGSPTDQRLPARPAWGGYPGGLTVTKGAPLFPASAG